MTCRVHKCQNICCPAKRNEDVDNLHACVQLCGKTDVCAKHPCSRFCHNGPCPPCDIMVNISLACYCGAQRINPPIKCGTEIPICFNVCNQILGKCGHACYEKCHFGDCNPCQETVDKGCCCGKVIWKTLFAAEISFVWTSARQSMICASINVTNLVT